MLLLHQALGSFPTDVRTKDKCTDICTHTNEWGYRQITDKERERGKRRVPLRAFLDICWEYGPSSSRILSKTPTSLFKVFGITEDFLACDHEGH